MVLYLNLLQEKTSSHRIIRELYCLRRIQLLQKLQQVKRQSLQMIAMVSVVTC